MCVKGRGCEGGGHVCVKGPERVYICEGVRMGGEGVKEVGMCM